MAHTVAATIQATVRTAGRVAVQVGVARPGPHGVEETSAITLDGVELPRTEVAAPGGGRIWVVDSHPGRLQVSYRAVVTRRAPVEAPRADDELVYLRPSRYCESDRMVGFATATFAHLGGPLDRLMAVSSWVGTRLGYVPGSSGPTDGAVDTLLGGQGVCRDYAHLVIALLRALDIPARMVAVYAPGLQPMDFHAVAEALIDGTWYVVDATLLAPRASLVRLATGRDAADTSFLSDYGGSLELDFLEVSATVEGDLPADDPATLVQLP